MPFCANSTTSINGPISLKSRANGRHGRSLRGLLDTLSSVSASYRLLPRLQNIGIDGRTFSSLNSWMYSLNGCLPLWVIAHIELNFRWICPGIIGFSNIIVSSQVLYRIGPCFSRGRQRIFCIYTPANEKLAPLPSVMSPSKCPTITSWIQP